MTDFGDDLDKLKAALKGAPAPEAAAKQAALDVAKENFARLQERGQLTRPTETTAKPAGFLKGLLTMFTRKSLKPLLLTTSSIVIVGVGSFVLLTDEPMPFKKNGSETTQTLNNNLSLGNEPLPEFAPTLRSDQGPSDGLSAIASDQSNIGAAQMEAVPLQPDFTRARKATAPSSVSEPNNLNRLSTEFFNAEGIRENELGSAPTSIDGSFGSVTMGDTDGTLDWTRPERESRDRFANEAPNPLKITIEDPVSTFSIDVDTASYAWVRRSLLNGHMPDPASVRVEEMVNYFPYDYAAPEGDIPFATTVTVIDTPWNADTQLVHIGIQGEMPAVEDRPPLNLVFLIDTSGSMNAPDKLPLLIQSFRLMLSELRPQDQVAIVTYAGSAGLVLAPTFASEHAKINAALSNLRAGGSTAGEAGLQQAYSVAENMAEEGEIGRVILATDGDFNVGQSSDAAMKALIEQKRESGTYLSVLGFGRGNINDSLMQTLAQNGNGQAAYIDTLSEARKVLVDQLTGALFPIASDVKLQVEFNPAQIAEYRLIGYETRALKREDFNNDAVDAGDIGAGHTVTALYEVTPVGSPAILNEPLRYDDGVTVRDVSSEIGFLRLRHKTPGESDSQLIETVISHELQAASSEADFATAIAGFAQLLRGSEYLGSWAYSDAISLAGRAKGQDRFGHRAEAITLMRLAESLAKHQ